MGGKEEIGCCGAYCKTCREFLKTCKGCKSGYSDGTRNLSKAKCKMKICRLNKSHATCADCSDFETCEIIGRFINHSGYKYSKYKQALEFIRSDGYDKFLSLAQKWKNPYGRYN